MDPKISVKDQDSKMRSYGYARAGYVDFRGDLVSDVELRDFAASIGADYVYKGVWFPSIEKRSSLVVSGYTPASTITSSTYGISNSNYNLNTNSSPYSNYNLNTTGSSNSYGTATTNTYLPAQVSYSRQDYDAVVANQIYVFWVSRYMKLYNWEELEKLGNPGKKRTKEEIKTGAAMYAQIHNLPLPKNLQPKNPVPTLSEKEKEIFRKKFNFL